MYCLNRKGGTVSDLCLRDYDVSMKQRQKQMPTSKTGAYSLDLVHVQALERESQETKEGWTVWLLSSVVCRVKKMIMANDFILWTFSQIHSDTY